MGTSVMQPSFAAGELSPTLFSRVDLARYQIGLKTCKNFTVMSGGGVQNRPGTRFVDATPDNGPVRLIRFKFSIDDACLLVFGNYKMRVVKDGAYVLSGGVPYEIATPWSYDDLFIMNYTQSADIMTFVHPLYRPRELKRFANDNWTITEPTYVPSVAAPASATAVAPAGSGTTQSWTYQITAVVDDAFSINESLPRTSNTVTVYASDVAASVSWPAVVGATYYNIYKDNTGGGVFGFIARATGLGMTDRNILPTKTDTPPTGFDPFVGAGNYPGAVGYYQQRKVYAGTLNKPQTLWYSRTGQYNNFGYSTPNKDDDAITWTMASTEVQRILNILPLRQQITFTNSGEWSIEGSGTGGFTAKNITGNPQSYNGSGYIQPLVLNDTALYLQGRGRAISSLNYSLEADGLSSTDLTIWSSHLFRDYIIKDWAYQRLPDSMVWCVRADGDMVGLTYMRTQDVVAWHHHETDGFFERICCVPEGGEDVVYVSTRRIIGGIDKRYIERMVSRNIPYIPGTANIPETGKRDVAMGVFVDCALSYYGWTPTTHLWGLYAGTDWDYPNELDLYTSSTEFEAGDVGRTFAMRDPVTYEVLYVVVTVFLNNKWVKVVPKSIVPVNLRGAETAYHAKCVQTLAGLGHLEGKAVAILADGMVVGGNQVENYVVVGGTITLPDPAAVVHIGLPYVSDLETLRINLSGQETLNDKLKTVTSVTLVVDESRGIFAGNRFDNLYELKQRLDENYNEPIDLLSGVGKIQIDADMQSQGQVCIRQSDPLPLTVLAIIPDLVVAGRM